MSGAQLRRARATAQLLAGDDGRSARDVVAQLLAVQAQDGPAAARALTVRGAAREAGGSAGRALGDRARTGAWLPQDPGSVLAAEGIVLAWLVRGTLHLACAEDWAWLHGLTAPTRVTANARRLSQEGVSPADADRGVEAIVRVLADDGPLSRARTRDVLGAARVPCAGQATPHVLLAAALRGRLVFDPATRDAVHVPDPPAPLEGDQRDRALAELGRRYLAGHAPADEHDLAHWSGLPLRDARRALEGSGTVIDREEATVLHPRLLGPFDPYLLGWRTRAHAVAARYARFVAPGGGIVRGVAIVDGLVVGTWTRAGGIDWLDRDVSSTDRAALEAQLP